MDIRYIADTHLFYAESLQWRKGSLDDYANELVINYNGSVTDDTEVRWVGDIGEYCNQTIEVLKELRGRKVLVLGNHDANWPADVLSTLFSKVYDHIQTSNLWIQHIPPELTNPDCYVIHGHHHEYDSPSMVLHRNSYLHDRTRYNCAADLNGNRPCTLMQLMINKETLKEKVYGKDTGNYGRC